MALKLAIANVVGVKVEGNVRDENGNEKPYKFTLMVDRLTQDELRDAFRNQDETVGEFFEKHARGWKGQNLVLEEDGRAAEFSVEALRVLFSIGGMGPTCWQAYASQVGVAAKN